MQLNLASFFVLVFIAAGISDADGADVLPRPEPPFKGRIEVNARDSVADWPLPVRAPQGAPNILLIMLDDVGFADTATFGGLAKTPVLDQLAAEGLRYNRFHTAGICSPTRAALLSGRNHHRVGYGAFGAIGYPGYDGLWKRSTVSIAEVLKRNGYNTAAFGKWHNTPYQDISPIGPFERWPTSLGFEYYYGNLLGLSSQWEPLLWRNTTIVAPPATPQQGYHFTTDITDEAIRWVRSHDSLASERPYFVYFAPEAAHFPHHVPKEWIDRYRGLFDRGWDKLREEIFARQKKLGVVPPEAVLTPRPKSLPAWNSLPAESRRVLARQMEVFAAFVAHTDYEIGRLIRAVKAGPHADNTLIMFIVGDNGSDGGSGGITGEASGMGDSMAEQLQKLDELGSLQHINSYAAAWAWMGSTPFQWAKGVASHFGGTRNPLVVSWPARIKDRGALRSRFAHVNDIAATVYEAARIEFPESVDGVKQLPLDGVSLVDSFNGEGAPDSPRVQYFEILGNRAIFRDGWVAAARHFIPWVRDEPASHLHPSSDDFTRDRWELYHVAEDFSQAHDLAERYPQKLRELQALFDAQARSNDVYPLGAGTRFFVPPSWTEGKQKFVFQPGTMTLLSGLLLGSSRPHFIKADVILPESGATGAILAGGSRYGGVVLYIKDQRLIYENNVDGKLRETLISDKPVPAGKAQLVFELDRAAIGRLYINGAPVGQVQLTSNQAAAAWGPLEIGKNSVSPVSQAFEPPFEFTGTLEQVTLELK